MSWMVHSKEGLRVDYQKKSNFPISLGFLYSQNRARSPKNGIWLSTSDARWLAIKLLFASSRPTHIVADLATAWRNFWFRFRIDVIEKLGIGDYPPNR